MCMIRHSNENTIRSRINVCVVLCDKTHTVFTSGFKVYQLFSGWSLHNHLSITGNQHLTFFCFAAKQKISEFLGFQCYLVDKIIATEGFLSRCRPLSDQILN